ncbi:Signal transducing adapter molecule 1 [Blattella germanica]|nr:Signal transducing adapter molecule 1 [Blattella germanica]
MGYSATKACDVAGVLELSLAGVLLHAHKPIDMRLSHLSTLNVIELDRLLDACVNNCGKTFHLEVASRDFETEFRKLLNRSQPTVAEKLKKLLKKWAEGDFKNDPQLNLIPSLYAKLKQEGTDFSTHSDTPRPQPTVSRDPNVVSSQQEEDDIAKAIELSLKDTQHSPKVQSSLYPSTNLVSGGASSSVEARKVRALYDFEAAEDNELTFTAGEIIHVLDDSDPNWWKGYNYRGEGLFPANFVTADLSAEPEQFKLDQPRKSVQFNEAVQVKTVEEPQEVEINEEKIDRLLHLLHEADPTENNSDSEEMLNLEEQVNSMGPLIDQELERVDRKHAQLTQLSFDLVEALNLYHTLMREPAATQSYHTMPKQVNYGYPSPHMYNGVPGNTPYVPQQYSLPPGHEQYAMSGPSGPSSMTLPPNFHQMGPLPPGVPVPVIGPNPRPEDQQRLPSSGTSLPFSHGGLPNYGPSAVQPPSFPHPAGPLPQQHPPGPGANYPPNGQPLL